MKTRIWHDTQTFPGKVNFIDDNNVVLGYELGSFCCEHAFWVVSEDKEGTKIVHNGEDMKPAEIELDGYIFDPEFFERSDDDNSETYVALFKLVFQAYGKKKPDLYIRLENHQNGYYSHGFVFRGAKTIEETI